MRHPQPFRSSSALVFCLATAGWVAGCQSDKPQIKPVVDQGPMYTGDRIFYGTIGSLASFANDEPMLVSGYGLVVGLNGTGSGEVPPALLPYMKEQVRRANLNPTAVLSDPNTAVVSVQGLIQPGAAAGDRFDLWVESPVSSVTSLANGNLYSTDLQPGSASRDLSKNAGLAGIGAGHIYMDPFDRDTFAASGHAGVSWAEFQRQGLILGGGRVSSARPLGLMLNQPSFLVANQITDAINTRFPQGPGDRLPVAVAHDDQRIVLTVPAAFRRNPADFIEQVRWLYIQRIDPTFVPAQTQNMLAAVAEESRPEMRAAFADHCVQAWKAMGRGALPKLRPAYTLQPNSRLERELWPDLAAKDPAQLEKNRANYAMVREAAVHAGLALGDGDAVDLLVQSLPRLDAAGRRRVAEMLAEQPNNQGVLSALRGLIGDPDTAVRVAAYESYAACFAQLADVVGPARAEQLMGGDFHRTLTYDRDEAPRFAVDVVPIGEPLVVMALNGWPRVAILGRDSGLKKPSSVWFEGDVGRRMAEADPAALAQAAKELAAQSKLTLAQAKAQIEKLQKESAPIPFAGAGRLNLRAQDEATAEEVRTAAARRLQAGRGIPFAQALQEVPAMREVLAFSFYPGTGGKQEFKAANTLATLAFTLGQYKGSRYPQPGLDFQFDRVARVLNELARHQLIEAPVIIRLSPLADRMRRAAEAARQTNAGRPEGKVEDLTKELGPGAKPKAPPAAPGQPEVKKPEAAPAGTLPSWK